MSAQILTFDVPIGRLAHFNFVVSLTLFVTLSGTVAIVYYALKANTDNAEHEKTN